MKRPGLMRRPRKMGSIGWEGRIQEGGYRVGGGFMPSVFSLFLVWLLGHPSTTRVHCVGFMLRGVLFECVFQRDSLQVCEGERSK